LVRYVTKRFGQVVVHFHKVALAHCKFTLIKATVCSSLPGSHTAQAIRHLDIRMKHYACGHSVATLLNPLGVTTVSRKYTPAVAVAVLSAVHYPANYKIKYILR
jgi:hypothetical protein